MAIELPPIEMDFLGLMQGIGASFSCGVVACIGIQCAFSLVRRMQAWMGDVL
mgnify:CR=1 FL=1